jgi:hypothetical protein
MPPNRKSPTLFTSSYELENLKIPLQAKFLPLTDPREAAQQQKCVRQELKPDPKTEKAQPTVSYWDWLSDTAEEEKVEAIDDLFSLSRFESNLIADSVRREEDSTVQVSVTKSNEKEGQTEENQSYWDWSNEDVDDVEPEIDGRDDKPNPQTEDHHCEECCDDYWAWQDNEVTEDERNEASPSRRLHNVVNESRKKFTRRHSHLSEPDHPSDAIAVSNHYWHWLEFRSNGAN